MRHCLLVVLLAIAVSASAQCSHTNYGNGFTCVQTANPTASSGTVATNQQVLTLPASTTPGDGIIVFGNYCTVSGCTSGTGPIANVYMSDGANDTGWQPCSFNGSTANNLRFWYCWWLPVVGTTTTFTIHATGAYGLGIWVAELSGGCNMTACIDSVAAPVLCAGGSPCGVPITTSNTQLLIIGNAYLAGTALNPAAGWNGLVSSTGGNAIGNTQVVPGVYSPTWTSTAMPAMMAVAIKSPTSSLPPTTVPTLPVF